MRHSRACRTRSMARSRLGSPAISTRRCAPTGGDKGAGTANFAADIYKNNTAYTNPAYVFEHCYTGRIVIHAEKDGAAEYRGLQPLDTVAAYTRERFELPVMDQQREAG